METLKIQAMRDLKDKKIKDLNRAIYTAADTCTYHTVDTFIIELQAIKKDIIEIEAYLSEHIEEICLDDIPF